jgi:DNA topoisomerase-1
LLQKTPAIPHPEEAAALASLSYITDAGPGISRRRRGRGFAYYNSDGSQIRDEAELSRIRSLAIPPAYTDVWISPDPEGHIQATGRDARGRKQYRYHPRWRETRDAAKYGSLAAFGAALPDLRAAIDADLRKRGLSRERVLASIVWLLEHTLIRIGNQTYARDNKSFGLTTLRRKHVELDGSRVRFRFRGKSGKNWELQLVDRRMVRIMRSMQEMRGQHLFQYEDEDGERRLVHSHDVNDYLREATGHAFTSKHFRTWAGTVTAARLLIETPLPETQAATKIALNKALDEVARRLGNTRTVCRSCYVHPLVLERWSEGSLADDMAAASRRTRPIPGLEPDEAMVLNWLRRTPAA